MGFYTKEKRESYISRVVENKDFPLLLQMLFFMDYFEISHIVHELIPFFGSLLEAKRNMGF